MKEAIKYNKQTKSGYTRRELQLLTLKPYEHDAFEWCEKHLPVLGKMIIFIISKLSNIFIKFILLKLLTLTLTFSFSFAFPFTYYFFYNYY